MNKTLFRNKQNLEISLNSKKKKIAGSMEGHKLQSDMLKIFSNIFLYLTIFYANKKLFGDFIVLFLDHLVVLSCR